MTGFGLDARLVFNDAGIDVNTQLVENGKQIKGLINIAQYNPIGDGTANDLTAINNAITAATTNGYAINWGWDNKTYLVTDTIPNFHTIKHIGNAIIKRGTDLFYISPRGTQTNNLYVATTGNTTNDGLTSNKPMSTIQKAFDALANYSPILTGNWTVNLAAGTYSRAVLKDALLSENTILLKGVNVGGYPNVPTSIVSDGATGVSATGVQANKGSVLTIQDVKFIGYNGNSSSNGASCSEASRLYLINAHFTDCNYGASATHRSYLDVKDGIYDHCGYLSSGTGSGAALRTLMVCNHYIGDQNGSSLRVEIKNCYTGVQAQENSTGHVNWVDFHDNIDAVKLYASSRANLDGCSFKRNARDVRFDATCVPYIPTSVVFGTGADESTNKLVQVGGNLITDDSKIMSGFNPSYSITEKKFAVNYLAQSINTNSATVFHSTTLKAPLWRFTPNSIAIGRKLHFQVSGVLNGTLGNKRFNVRLSNGVTSVVAQCLFSSSETGAFQASGDLYFTGADTQYVMLSSQSHLSSMHRVKSVGSVTMTTDATFTLEAYIDDGTRADSVLIDMVEVGWAG